MFNKNQENLFSYELSKGINLFLGAGFSVLPNDLDEKFPNAKELCAEICDKFGIDDMFRDDLYSASEMVPESEYQIYLRNRFTVNGGINRQYYLLDKLNIKNIITTNIDNIVPTIYDSENAVHYINDRSFTLHVFGYWIVRDYHLFSVFFEFIAFETVYIALTCSV